MCDSIHRLCGAILLSGKPVEMSDCDTEWIVDAMLGQTRSLIKAMPCLCNMIPPVYPELRLPVLCNRCKELKELS